MDQKLNRVSSVTSLCTRPNSTFKHYADNNNARFVDHGAKCFWHADDRKKRAAGFH